MDESPRAEEAPAAGEERTALVLDTTPGATVLASALGVTTAEAGYRVQRGRFVLHRILPPAEAEEEAERLARHGLTAVPIPEREIREGARPLLARSGDPDSGTFVIEPGQRAQRIEPGVVRLVVWGPIRRESAEPDRGPLRGRRRLSPSGQDGELYHLHLREGVRPIEIDPWAFRFSESRGQIESSALRMRWAVERLAGASPVDRSFRFEPPALAPSSGAPEGPAEGASNLLRQAQSSFHKRPSATDLDNVGQFRFHSSWLAAVTRRRG